MEFDKSIFAGSNRFDSGSPLSELIQHPYRFDFFQAVRLLSWAAGQSNTSLTGRVQKPVGIDWQPSEEFVRFRSHVGHSFTSGQILSLDVKDENRNENDATIVPALTVTFMGLAGTNGILPRHYTQLIIDRSRSKDIALREFLELFNHRLISHYYRAWEKYHFYVGYESAHRDSQTTDDPFTKALYCLVGQGTGGLRGRQDIADETFLHYSGHFAHFPRTATSLQQLIHDYLNVRVSIKQFQGQWLYLRPGDQTKLTSGASSIENNQLGVTAIAGQRIWGIENKFRICLGPLSYSEFCRYMPDGDSSNSLGQLTRSYVGPELDFEVQLILRKADVPPCAVGRDTTTRLGWNSWLCGSPLSNDADEAVFDIEGSPNR